MFVSRFRDYSIDDIDHRMADGVRQSVLPAFVCRLVKGQKRLDSSKEIFASSQKFFNEHFPKLKADLGNILIPRHHRSINNLVVVAQGLTIQIVHNRCAELFQCGGFTDYNLDEFVPRNIRDPRYGSYAIWVGEPDINVDSLSPNTLRFFGPTLLETLLIELMCFTLNHTRPGVLQYCSGSRYSDADTPIVYWTNKLYIDMFRPSFDGRMFCRKVFY